MIRPLASALLAVLLASPAVADRVEPAREREAPELLKKQKENRAEPGAPGAPALRDRKAAEPRPARPPGVAPDVDPNVPQPASAELLTVETPDTRLGGAGDRFVVLAGPVEARKFVSCDLNGENPADIVAVKGKLGAWWTAAGGKSLAWIADGRLHVFTPGGADTDLGPAPAGAPAFSPDGTRLAFVADGRLQVVTLDGKEKRSLAGEAGVLPAGPAAWAADGRRVFCLVSATDAAAPDGIGAADFGAEGAVVKRLYQASNATLSELAVSPNGKWLLFVQTGKAGQAPDALRLFATDGSEFRTLARAADIAAPVFSPEGSRVYFAGLAANRRWGAYEAGIEPDPATGETPTRPIVFSETHQFLCPVPSSDGMHVWVVAQTLEGSGAGAVAKVKVR